jgi:hypothetical protein
MNRRLISHLKCLFEFLDLKNILKANEFISIKYEEFSKFPYLIINICNKIVSLFEERIIKVLFN